MSQTSLDKAYTAALAAIVTERAFPSGTLILKDGKPYAARISRFVDPEKTILRLATEFGTPLEWKPGPIEEGDETTYRVSKNVVYEEVDPVTFKPGDIVVVAYLSAFDARKKGERVARVWRVLPKTYLVSEWIASSRHWRSKWTEFDKEYVLRLATDKEKRARGLRR